MTIKQVVLYVLPVRHLSGKMANYSKLKTGINQVGNSGRRTRFRIITIIHYTHTLAANR